MKETQLPDVSWLEAYRTDSPNFGLERMERLLELRGKPHLQLSVIHIAGTNGKGSTIAHLRQLLQQKGLKVGTFTSPYLVSYNEQIAINGSAISDLDLQQLLTDYQALLAQQADDALLLGVTEFEIATALAYDYFVQQQVDVALIEVGMGGLLDSTNVCRPDLTAISTIGLDHVALLGDSLEK
ncbi:Dihydrofolate synthase / Folylpolyglutamate synthase [Streptococcus sp. DD11]|nr:Dihydrofolate synthase / Folylpolyglutamate synthase [Streptococcus sp. DD11]